MSTLTPARVHGRTRRALLAAILPATLAALALPSAANAAVAEVVNASGTGVLGYSAAAGEVNNVRVGVFANQVVISDAAPITAGNGCNLNVQGDAECSIGVGSISMQLGDQNDIVQYTAPHPGFVSGQDGDDVFFGGLRQAVLGRPIQPAIYVGGGGADTIDYVFADRGVRVDTDDNPSFENRRANDGRPGDLDSVHSDVERIQGSRFADVLFGSSVNNVIIGLDGDDQIGGGDGNDFIREDQGPNGADSINGGSGVDRVLYSGRPTGVNVSLDGIANDGQSGEGDDVRPNVENVTGSPNGGDVIVGNSLANDFHGFGGNDNLIGAGGDDTLSGGSGNNRLAGDAGNDVINARNGELDNIECGEDRDTANRDSAENRVVGCESGTVGVLRLTPASVRADAGERVRMRLSWRHPRAWRELRTVELRLTHDGAPVGEITIRPRRKRIAADGAVTIARRATRLTHEGKAVTARLALRLDESLAGQTLKAEVEATDRRGRRQLERDAATVRLAP